MKNRIIAVALVTTIICSTLVTSACTTNENKSNNNINVVKSEEIIPFDLAIDSGDINNKTGLKTTYKLNKSNGKYVNLYVENNGTNSVVATINGCSKKTFGEGEKDYISVEVNQGFLGVDNEYEFKVVTDKNGGTVNIHYEIVQGNNKSL